MSGVWSILLLIISNVFMTLAWYGHLQFKKWGLFEKSGLWVVVLVSWVLAFFEYIFQVPANKIGYSGNNGPFSMFQLKIIQEVISLIVFSVVVVFVFRAEKPSVNHIISFVCILLAVYFAFKK